MLRIGKICGGFRPVSPRDDETASLGRGKRRAFGGDGGGIARTPSERKVAEMLFRRLRAAFIAWEIALEDGKFQPASLPPSLPLLDRALSFRAAFTLLGSVARTQAHARLTRPTDEKSDSARERLV